MKTSLIIAYYKNIPALKLIFTSLDKQSCNDFEVIVAEDDAEKQTVEFLKQERPKHAFAIKHIQQEQDNGFRKNQMLNRAIQKAAGELIVFLDGDTIPHKHFIKTYKESVSEGTAAFGRRVMLSKKLTDKLIKTNDLSLLRFPSLLFSASERLKYSLYLPFVKSYRETGIWGCNWGILKKHLIRVNGFDEDYVKAGYGEDVDVEWRLKKMGIKLLSVRFGALVYHLYHKPNYSETELKYNFEILENKKAKGKVFCDNGLQKDNRVAAL